MKDTLIEIKNNLQGNNSTVDEAKSQINDLEHKEENPPQKQTNKKTPKTKEQPIRTRRKKNPKK